jgi:hypothetical protein
MLHSFFIFLTLVLHLIATVIIQQPIFYAIQGWIQLALLQVASVILCGILAVSMHFLSISTSPASASP